MNLSVTNFFAGILLAAPVLAAAPGASFSVLNTGPENKFARVATPAAGAPAPLGFYSAGCVRGAQALSLNDPSLVVMKPSRNRYYGLPPLLALLEKAKTEAPRPAGSPLLLGDLSQPRGGPMPIGHASHQLGLDADVWFTPEAVLRAGKVSAEERESLTLETVLDQTRKAVNEKRWRPEFAEEILWFAARPEVQRIFVHGAIKKKLCATHRAHPFLAKVRPWYFHDSHFHVRLRCPAGAEACESQPDVKDAGCDASIDHWLTPAALKIQKELPKQGIPRRVKLPEACRAIADR